MDQKTKAVLIISENPSLAVWCNQVLGKDFQIVWIKSIAQVPEGIVPLSVISDFAPKQFEPIYINYQQKRIKCFNTSSAVFTDSERRRFPKAKFIEPGNDHALSLSILSECKLSVPQTEPSITEYSRKLYCAAASDETVLLLGKMGAGKTHDAKMIHNLSKRKDKAFVSFTMAESNMEAIEGELFGIAKNAFTGVSPKEGLLSQAQGGTIFFDEITEIPLEMQTKLLTVISERKFRQKGNPAEIKFTGRFIFATNADIDRLVEEKKFRADLYSRINVLRLRVPDLNDHSEDIAQFAIAYASEQNKTLTKDVIRTLEKHEWTGNIRQLRNIVIRACTFAKTDTIQLKDLSFD